VVPLDLAPFASETRLPLLKSVGIRTDEPSGLAIEAGAVARGFKLMQKMDLRALARLCPSLVAIGSPVRTWRLSERRRLRTTSRAVANSSPRQTHERRVLHEGASFALCAGISRAITAWPWCGVAETGGLQMSVRPR